MAEVDTAEVVTVVVTTAEVACLSWLMLEKPITKLA